MISDERLKSIAESEMCEEHGNEVRCGVCDGILAARELLAARAQIADCEAECTRLLVQLRALVAELEMPRWKRLWMRLRRTRRPSMAALTRALEPQRRPGESDEELRKRIQG